MIMSICYKQTYFEGTNYSCLGCSFVMLVCDITHIMRLMYKYLAVRIKWNIWVEGFLLKAILESVCDLFRSSPLHLHWLFKRYNSACMTPAILPFPHSSSNCKRCITTLELNVAFRRILWANINMKTQRTRNMRC